MRRGNADKGIDFLRQSLEYDPENVEVLTELARALISIGMSTDGAKL